MMRIDVLVSDRDGTVHSVVSGEHLLEGMAEQLDVGGQKKNLASVKTGTIIELEGGNRCDIKLESDGKSEEHDGD